ncbi:MAG: HD domain-containing protein [Lachnospiraceae bacterium]|nr:HD domain-containing protein [Lachnospiraceae bacterium]
MRRQGKRRDPGGHPSEQLDQAQAEEILKDIKAHERVQEMKQYIQHGRISTYEHCDRVAHMSFRINRKLHLNANERELLTAAMLHDFYLYDWHNYDDNAHPWHGYHHADKAVENARLHFRVSPRVQKAIWSHMWPLNITRIPRTRESWILCLADKIVSVKETLMERK